LGGLHVAIATKLAAVRVRMRDLGVWQARLLAFGLGVLAVFAMPPTYQIYLLIPAFSGLLWLSADASSRWRAFAVGWWFGAGFFAAGLYWISFALLVDADKFAWLFPFAVFGFAFGIGLFCAVTALVVRMVPGSVDGARSGSGRGVGAVGMGARVAVHRLAVEPGRQRVGGF